MTLRHVHTSGRFDATPSQLANALNTYVGEGPGGFGADVITLTEVSPNQYDQPLRAWAGRHGFELHHPTLRGRDECAVLSRRPIEKRKAWRLTDLTLKVGRTAPLYLVAVKLRDGPWFAVWHTPAHNMGLSTFGKAAVPTRVYRSALTGLRHSRLKILYWDGTGLWLLIKRLEQGTFSWPKVVDPQQVKLKLAPEALAMLTDGIDLRGAKMRQWFERE